MKMRCRITKTCSMTLTILAVHLLFTLSKRYQHFLWVYVVISISHYASISYGHISASDVVSAVIINFIKKYLHTSFHRWCKCHVFQSINFKTSSNAVNVLCGFKFIPLFKSKMNDQISEDGLITRTMTEDTSYLLVKMDGDILDADGNKRLGGLTKKNQLRSGSQPVDLR